MVQLSDRNFPTEAKAMLERFSQDGAPIVVKHDEKDVGVLISLEEFELLQRLEDYLDADEVRLSKSTQGDEIDWKDLVEELGL
jgi:PHD/YefM family antitoxin component YafN of YafNO toxin-antitoxin module